MRFAWLTIIALIALGGCRSESLQTAQGMIAPALKAVADATQAANQAVTKEAVVPQAVEAGADDDQRDLRGPPPGYIEVRPSMRSGPRFGHAVLLVELSGQTVVPIFIGGTEALSIKLRLAKRPFVRPLTHDLLDDIMKRMGGKMVRAQVDKLKSNTYIGTVVIAKGNDIMPLDSRPSDAIALAIGNGVPIYVSETLLRLVGVRVDDDEEPRRDPNVNPIEL